MDRYFLRAISLPLQFDLKTGLNSIGRNQTNDYRVPEASVSSFHCEVTVDNEGVHVHDLQSTNGTFVDDERISDMRINVGQVLQLGTVTFRLEREEIVIRIPKVAAEPTQATSEILPLEDGQFPCRRNPALPATHQCEKCDCHFHISSIRGMRMASGKKQLLFCPECDGPCLPIPGAANAKKGSFLGSLTKTIAMGWRRK